MGGSSSSCSSILDENCSVSIKNSYANKMFHPPNPPSYQYLPNLQMIEYLNKSKKIINKLPFVYLDNNSSTTILYSHGNATDIGQIFEFMQQFSKDIGVNMILWDYPGYGIFEGELPTEESVTYAIQQLWKYYSSHIPIIFPSQKLIIWGTSIGSGPSSYLASWLTTNFHKTTPKNFEPQYNGLILESPLYSAISTVVPQHNNNNSTTRTISCIDSFKNYKYVTTIDRDVFLIHGTEDKIIPYVSSKLLWEKIPKNLRYKFWAVDGADHNDIIKTVGYDTYVKAFTDFVDALHF